MTTYSADECFPGVHADNAEEGVTLVSKLVTERGDFWIAEPDNAEGSYIIVNEDRLENLYYM